MVEVTYLRKMVKWMLKLEDKEWGEFKLSKVFTIVSTKSSIDKIKLNGKSGSYPYITRSELNNGINEFIDIQEEYSFDFGNCITIGLDTQTAFYQKSKFYTGQNIQVLRNEHINEFNAKFVLPLLKNLMVMLSWGGNGATLTRLKRSIIILPISKQDCPDWDFMEQYIKERYDLLKSEYQEKVLCYIPQFKEIPKLEKKEWKEFKLNEIFTKLQAGKSKGLNHLKQIPDGISYLSATNRNNGVSTFVERKSKLIQEGNCIAFVRNGEGSMGYSVYKAEAFIATSDITVGYFDELNKYIGLFITTIADQVRGKYNFNYKRSDTRLAKETLQLPIDENKNPDWNYMEQYSKNIVHKKLNACFKK